MPRQNENGFVLQERNGVIHLVLTLTLKRRMLWTLLVLLVLLLMALGSSANEDIRKIILDFLLGAVQLALSTERHPKP
jgi:hypothetical protein